MNNNKIKQLTEDQRAGIVRTLKTRFEKYNNRHKGVEWSKVQARLEEKPEKLYTLYMMEQTGGEPDVTSQDKKTGEYIFCDCSMETPKGRRSICYDREAWEARKQDKPKNTAMDMATEMGMEILTEEQYRELQNLGDFDSKTSSWLKTPAEIRKLGGAIFGDRRYNQVFVFHNGADCYYAARGFRGMVRI